jgi:hypothetical protein
VTVAPAAPGGMESPRSPTSYSYVLDRDDRILDVLPRAFDGLAPFVGQVLWERLPGAEPLLRQRFDEARLTGQEVEFAVFYAGRIESVRAVPLEDGLAVQIEQLTELDIRTLATLAESLLQIEAELAARESGRHGRPTLSSPRALP